MRWQHPLDGLLTPDLFIPLAEQTGLVTKLGDQVLLQACADVRAWRERPGAADMYVTVNLSAVQLVDVDLVDRVGAAMSGAGLPAGSLVLEITETMLTRDPNRAADTLGRLKALGVQVAVDDFGTGHSSLAYLRRFPVDMLKIATEFTQGLGSNPDDDIVTHAIIQLAGALGLRTVAEGIETSAQHADLVALSCPLGQGYLFSRPVEAHQIHELLAANARRLPLPTGSAA